MDKGGNRKVAPARNRVSSNSSTPSSGISRGTSTPTGSSSKNRSCNFSPITNPDVIKSAGAERCEPKLLKPLGPSFPQSNEKKNIAFKTRSAEDQATLLYMAYQQQHFLNNSFEKVKDKIEKDCKKQLEDLWALVKMREKEVDEMKERARLVRNHSDLSCLVNQIEPVIKHTKEQMITINPLVQELAQGLDNFRHQIRLDEINEFKKEDMDEMPKVLKKNATFSEKIKLENLEQAISLASTISELDNASSNHIKMMEECQDTSSQIITRLGQELSLSEGEKQFKKLCEL